ncbi:MAG: transcriptional regulator, AraC family [Devosia sp.]|uniref:helix-turn-helix transcriptional regulator n=1 Tax=Devosia sp. TaxID=1871048 RepID=UPI002636CB8B|nr:AraC family transcriptional regulator [Devosia sp.]MDB5585721.1 transcriptional regulator, AraC family [Devosia sp.]
MDDMLRALSRPAVFRAPGALLYAGNCADLLVASEAGKVVLNAWTRCGYPGLDLDDALPQVCSVGGWDATLAQDWGLKEHCNEGVKIAYVARGNLALTLDGQRHELSQGQVFVLRPWQLHAYGDPHVGPSQIIWVLFDMGTRRPHEKWHWPSWLAWPERDEKRLTELLSKNERTHYQASRALAQDFEAIVPIIANNEIDRDEVRLRLTISTMLMHLVQQIETHKPDLDQTLTRSRRTVRIFLDRLWHALDEDWTLQNMAAECKLSRTRFAHHCLALTNTTPARYLHNLRLAKAHLLLTENPDLSVTAVAYDCGFSSSQYFATSFKRRYGVSPKERRSQARTAAV